MSTPAWICATIVCAFGWIGLREADRFVDAGRGAYFAVVGTSLAFLGLSAWAVSAAL